MSYWRRGEWSEPNSACPVFYDITARRFLFPWSQPISRQFKNYATRALHPHDWHGQSSGLNRQLSNCTAQPQAITSSCFHHLAQPFLHSNFIWNLSKPDQNSASSMYGLCGNCSLKKDTKYEVNCTCISSSSIRHITQHYILASGYTKRKLVQ